MKICDGCKKELVGKYLIVEDNSIGRDAEGVEMKKHYGDNCAENEKRIYCFCNALCLRNHIYDFMGRGHGLLHDGVFS